ncbi:MAG: hypothetical protein ABWY11_08410 [Umezawaea sp.]
MTTPTPPAETVLWEGRPAAFPFLHRSDMILWPGTLLVGGFFVHYFFFRSTLPFDGFDVVFPVFFGALVFYNLIGRSLVRWLALRGSEYVVTDRRVVVRTTILGRVKERGEWLTLLEPPVLREAADGTGSITFGEPGLLDWMGGLRVSWKKAQPPPELVRIADARRVCDLIAEARTRVPRTAS